MKKLISFSILTASLLFASCASDKKDDPLAPTTSTGDERDKFVATWSVNETSTVLGGTANHTVTITKSTALSSEILINNFSGLSASARASVSGSLITIPYQQLASLGFAKGSGTLTSSTNINMTYTTAINGGNDTCSAIYTKQ